jgi:hypothetical protein
VGSLGGSENATKKAFDVSPGSECTREEISGNAHSTLGCISKHLISCMAFAPFTAKSIHAAVLLDFKHYLTIQ